MNIVTKALKLAKKRLEENNFQESEELSDQILRVDPNNIVALELLGISKKYLNKPKESINCFKKITNLCPKNYQGYNNLGLSYMNVEEYDKAIECLLKAAVINPKSHIHWRNLGCVFRAKKEFENSINFYKTALSIKENDEDLVGLAEVCMELLNIKEAIKHLRRAIKINKNNTAAHVDLGYAYFLNEDFYNGYKKYQYRFKHYSHLKQYKKYKKWKGQEGKVLLFCEQGTGDIFNFIRFVDSIKNKNIKVLIPEDVAALLHNQNFNFEIITSIKENFDYACSIIDLPHILKISKEEIKNSFEPYIKSKISCNFSNYKEFYKIGICWTGNPRHLRDEFRSCRLSLFKEISEIQGVKLFSLQKDFRKRCMNGKIIDFCENSDHMKVVDMSPFMKDWNYTASIINELDLIISVDTAVLHLSAAMGKKTIGLLPKLPDWRWELNYDSTFWYPSLKILRQKNTNQWNDVFEEAKKEVINLLQPQPA